MVDCNINNVSAESFKGLETYLHTLDVSNNNLTEFPIRKLQQNFNSLFKLGLRDNRIKNLFSLRSEESEKVIKSGEKKKTKDKFTDRDENKNNPRENDYYHEFFSLRDFDFSGWKNGPLQINTINGYRNIILNS